MTIDVSAMLGDGREWQLKKLSDLAKVDRGVSWGKPQESWQPAEQHTPVLRIGNVQLDGIHLDEVLYINQVKPRDLENKRIRPETIVMVGSNGNVDRVGNAFLAGDACDGFLYASFLIGITPFQGELAPYLAYWLRSPDMQTAISSATSGSVGLKNLSLTWLRSLPVLLPPDDRRHDIVHALTAIQDAADAAREKRSALLALRDAVVAEVVDGALTAAGLSGIEPVG